MAKPRFALKRDGNHGEIVEYLSYYGVSVTDTSAAGKLCDLLTAYPKTGERCFVTWIEVKMLKGARWTYDQLKFIAETSIAVGIAETKEQALELARTHNGKLTQDQKNRLAVYLQQDKKKLYTPAQVKEMLGV